MLNQDAGFNLWGNTSSVKQYYKTQSDGKFILNSTIVDVDLAQPSSYYHARNLPYNGGLRLVNDVVAAINAKYPSGFTGLTIHPTDDRLWHFSIISQSSPEEGAGVAYGTETNYILNDGIQMPIRNVALISYTQTNAYDINVICHEYGHSVFSWTDYYATAYCNLGDYDVMASAGTSKAPQPLNPALRLQKNWITQVINIDGTMGATYTLQANNYSQIHKYTNPSNPKEYLLFHVLQHGGYYQSPLDNGKTLDQGMAIWYVDEDFKFDVPGVDQQYFIRLIQADNLDEMHDEFIPNSSDVRGDLNDLYDNVSNSFPNGHPFRWKDGGEFGISISNISAPGASMSFTVLPRSATVLAGSDANGNISPKGTLAVTSGQSRTFTFTPNLGYEIDVVRVNGTPVSVVNNTYTMTSISGTRTIQATFRKSASIAPLPSPWVFTEIGTTLQAGLAVQSAGKFSLETYTSQFTGSSDQVGYIFQTLNGDGSIVAKLESFNMPSWSLRAGIMVRESLQANAPYTMICRAPHSGAYVQKRSSAGAISEGNPTGTTSNLHIYSLHNWFRISRSGNTFTMSTSRNGIDWTTISTQTITMTNAVHVGMVVSGANGSYAGKATFSNVVVNTSNPSPTVSITSPANNATVAAGSPLTINATAADANGSINRVDFYNGNSLIGSDNIAPYSISWPVPGGGKYTLVAKAIDNQGAITSSVPVVISVPCTFSDPMLSGVVIGTEGSWANQGNTRDKAFDQNVFTFFDAPIDIAWTGLSLPGNFRVTGINFYPREVFSGRMLNGKFQGSNTADFSSGVVDLATITVEPSYEWNCITISNTNTFRYVRYICAEGGVGNVAEIEFYGVQVINNQAPSVTLTSPLNGASYTAPASISLSATASDADGSVSKVEFFRGTTKIGEDVSSPYSITWSNVAAGTYSITAKATDNLGASSTTTAISITVNPAANQTPYGGVAWAIPGTVEAENYDLGGQDIAFNETTAGNSGSAYRNDAVDIEGSAGGGYNVGWIQSGEWLEYTVNITAGTYTIQALVAAPTAGKNFQLLLDGASIATIQVPNTGGWQNWQTVSVTNIALSGGQKVLRMLASTSEFNFNRLIFVRNVSNQLPNVSLTGPGNGASFAAPAAITISANASDADGSISKVEFFQGTTKIGEDLSSPYSFNWNNVAAGTYSISARATDNVGAIANSSSVSITVTTASNQTPYGGTAWTIPGIIEAENYDLGGASIAFNELSAGNSGNAYRSDAVDIEACSEGGFNVGWIQAGEWLEYTVQVTQAGTYTVNTRVASNMSSGSLQYEWNGINISNVLSVPFTGGWQNWQTISQSGIVLSVGQHILRLKMTGNDFNVNRIEFVRTGNASKSIWKDSESAANWSVYPNPMGNQHELYFSEVDKIATVKVMNGAGQMVMELPSWNTSSPISLESLPAGIYQLILESEEGTKHTTIIR